MANIANYEKTFSAGMKIGGTALVYTVAAETLLNRTSWSAPVKGAAAGGVALAGGMLLAGHTPNIAAGLIVGGVVYLGQTAARRAKLDSLVDKMLTSSAPATTTTAQGGASNPAPAPTSNQLQPVQTAPSGALPSGRSRVYVDAQGVKWMQAA